MRYIDGFVLVVPKNKREEYKKMAEEGAESWLKHGALQYMECVGDDMNPEMCEMPFPTLVNSSPDEEVWFSFIVYESKSERDRINALVMEEMGAQYPDHKPEDMPFDMKKMSFGGFQSMVDR